MNAFELYNEKGEPCGVWCCGECRKLVLNPAWLTSGADKSTREAAEACCRKPVCETCGKEYPHRAVSTTMNECSSCESKRWDDERQEVHLKRMEKAEDVTETYDGPIFCDEAGSGDMGEGFFSNVEALREYLTDESMHSNEWVFACVSSVHELYLDRAIEQICDDGYEDMGDAIEIPDSLNAAVKEFNEINRKALTVWEVDYKRKVRVRND